MHRARIVGTGMCVPARVVTNDELSKSMDTTDEWIRTRTGIRERRWVVEGETGAGMAHTASLNALAMAGMQPRDLDAIVYATSTPDHFIPGGGMFLQRLLDVAPIPALDIRMQCSGFIYALSLAQAWIATGEFQRILVVGAEIQSTGMDVSTRGRNTAVIFADGAGAMVLARSDSPDRGLLAFDLQSDGRHAELLWVDKPGSKYHPRISAEQVAENKHYLDMDGKEVYRHATSCMPQSVRRVLEKIGHTPGQIDLLLPHQANLRISEAVAKDLGLREDQVYNNIQKYGNTTAATIPLLLDECVRGGRVKEGQLLVFTAFGSGFAWGSAAVRW
ncbi:MAG TPA: beta-ketoacyl-ACP synthase III [Gemmatimonadales bacterium]|nr:beta-ketoacyl-ACP synthase III [Gemmatimonadales bacterium]